MRELKLKYLRYTIIHQKDTINWKIYYKSKYTIKVSLKLFNRAVNEKKRFNQSQSGLVYGQIWVV